MLSVLVPGGTGQLGRDLAALASPRVSVVAPGSGELDVTDWDAVTTAITAYVKRATRSVNTAIVINAAAYTAVDAAENDTATAYAVNAIGPRNVAAACRVHDVPLIHVSTDYVFPGDAARPYEPDDQRRPLNVYGRTKAAGEDAVLQETDRSWVVRTSWLYGATGANFLSAMVRLEQERETLTVVDDQYGSPTWTHDLAVATLELAQAIVGDGPPAGRVLHCTNTGSTTWCGFARAIFEELSADPERVKACGTAEFSRPAARPTYSVLSHHAWQQAGLTPLRHWREALHHVVRHHYRPS